ncbi:MAG: methyl-accepting chemotaxis protein [Thermodesulfovibrionia bacterium]|nr:methyl-accepting chemotaxis protein [Thermodesulfovibrionia bacterium]
MFGILTRMTIKKRLLLVNALILFLMSIMVLTSWIGFQAIRHDIAVVLLLEQEHGHLQIMLRGLSEFVVTRGASASVKLTREGIEKFDETYSTLISKLKDSRWEQEIEQKIALKWKTVKGSTESFLQLQRESINDAAMIKIGVLSAEADSLVKEVQSIAETIREQTDTETRKIIIIISTVIAIIISGTSLLLFFTYRSIAVPIVEITEMAKRAAAGDLTTKVEINSTDELGLLGNAINTMTVNLKDVISKIGNISNSVANVTSNIASASKDILEIADLQKKAVEETASAIEEMSNSMSTVSMSAESLSKSAGDTSSSIFQMTTSMDTLFENTNKFSDTTQSTTSSIEEMVINIKEIAESVEKLSATSSEIASSIEEVNDTTKNIAQSANESVILAERVMTNASDKGINAANAAMEGMEIIKNSVVTLSEVISTLGKRSNEIGKILNVIDSVAEQTNLLALNAAILAAKAGEHGRGFSIVANEIKDLAERTSKSTTEIASLIKSVQDETKSSVRMASEGVQTVQSGITLVKGVNDALREILDSSKVSTEMARAIQKATAEETVIIRHITNAVEEATHQIENISRATKEQSKGSSFIIEATAKMNEISYQLKTSLSEQRDGSRQIASATENVTNEASHIAASTGGQKEKSMDVVHLMEKIRNTTGNLTTSSNEMYEAVNSLKDEALNLLAELKKFKV